MKTPEIVAQLAHLLRQKDHVKKTEQEPKPQVSQKYEPKDAVELSPQASHFTSESAGMSDYEREQEMKVERLKALVQNGNYKMDSDMVAAVAEKIAKTFI